MSFTRAWIKKKKKKPLAKSIVKKGEKHLAVVEHITTYKITI